MSTSSFTVRPAPGFAHDFPSDRAYWERSADAGVTWAYNPPASVSHPGAAVAGTERYRLRFKIPQGLGGTFTFTISGDKYDSGGVGGTLWYDGVQISADTGTNLASSTVIATVPGPHTLEWRHGNWVSAGLTVPVIAFSYTNTIFTGTP